MNFTRLHGQNFLTLESFDLNLGNRGLLLIQGENHADSSASSNGAGKSSIPDALCWALYGVTARGVASDAVVNNKAKKNCMVEVVIDDEGETYTVTRYRKHATHKNQLFIKHKSVAGVETDLSKGTDAETQAVVDKILGCSLEVFRSSVYAGQEMMPNLPAMTDKNLKVLIEEASGVEVLSDAYAVARKQRDQAVFKRDTLMSSAEQSRQTIARHQTALAECEAQQAAFEASRRDRAKQALAVIPPKQREIAEAQAAISAVDVTGMKTQLAEIQKRLSEHSANTAKAHDLDRQVAVKQRTVDNLDYQAKAYKLDLAKRAAAIKNLDEQIGKPCGECGKAYCEHDLAAARATQIATARKVKENYDATIVQLEAARKERDDAQKLATEFRATLPDVSKEASTQRDLSVTLQRVEQDRARITRLTGEIELAKEAAKLRLSEANPVAAQVEFNKKAIANAQFQALTIVDSLNSAEEALALFEDAVKVFGPGGVRAHILDTVTPFLNDRTADILGALSDGNIHATWSTLKKDSKGELKEKFNIDVRNDKGSDTFFGMSGGEKRKARLASALALQDLVATRATKPINIFIADEIDDALDEPGLERLMGALDRKAKERGTVLVISHNALSDWIPEVITVTKNASGTSTVAGTTSKAGVF